MTENPGGASRGGTGTGDGAVMGGDDRPRPEGSDAGGSRTAPPRPPRRAVRPGAGDPEPSVALRALDDLDVGWQAATDDNNDERLRRDVPPHW